MPEARRYVIRGRVQGVGFRDFVFRAARQLGLSGFVRNESDGSVEVCASGPAAKLDELAGLLHRGPRMSEVRTVEQHEAAGQKYGAFEIL
jgi:acylphosphatase